MRQSACLFHELVGEKAVIGFERLVRLEQTRLDVETLRLLEGICGEAQVARRDLADVLERDRELAIVELWEPLLKQRQRLVRAVEHHGGCLAEGVADALAQRLAL